jgi:hypothetical protein
VGVKNYPTGLLTTYQNEFHEFQQQQPHLRKKAESVNLFYQPKKMDSPRK